jgi:hypothetical protein
VLVGGRPAVAALQHGGEAAAARLGERSRAPHHPVAASRWRGGCCSSGEGCGRFAREGEWDRTVEREAQWRRRAGGTVEMAGWMHGEARSQVRNATVSFSFSFFRKLRWLEVSG